MGASLPRRLAAEALGTAALLAAVVGSGIMGERLSEGNGAVALLANALATGAALFVLITVFGPVSGAQFNPVVTLAFLLRGDIGWKAAAAHIAVQLAGAVAGVWSAHLMFDTQVLELSAKVRDGPGQAFSEAVAAFGLVLAVLGSLRWRPDAAPATIALYITGAYWFTASTAFANPAATLARALSDSFAGIAPASVPAFVAAQLVGAVLGWLAAQALFRTEDAR